MSGSPALARLCVVLVEPRSPGNIGMTARAMANFGVHELRLVNPCDHLDAEARKFALNAAPILEGARCYATLPAALADLHLSVATTRRSGQNRVVPLSIVDLPPHVAALAPGERAGLVFGREDSGLTSEEVALCRCAATIPTDPGFASLNLAQAVLLCLYELARTAFAASAPAREDAPTEGDFEDLFRLMEQVLGRIGFFNSARPDLAMHKLRRIQRNSGLDRHELNLLRGMWAQLDWSVRDWEGRKRGGPRRKTD